jgi:hypothetical protein
MNCTIIILKLTVNYNKVLVLHPCKCHQRWSTFSFGNKISSRATKWFLTPILCNCNNIVINGPLKSKLSLGFKFYVWYGTEDNKSSFNSTGIHTKLQLVALLWKIKS